MLDRLFSRLLGALAVFALSCLEARRAWIYRMMVTANTGFVRAGTVVAVRGKTRDVLLLAKQPTSTDLRNV